MIQFIGLIELRGFEAWRPGSQKAICLWLDEFVGFIVFIGLIELKGFEAWRLGSRKAGRLRAARLLS